MFYSTGPLVFNILFQVFSILNGSMIKIFVYFFSNLSDYTLRMHS